MITSLHCHIDPANYHPEAVANANLGTISQIAAHWLIIRLGIALHKGDDQEAEAVLARISDNNPAGYELFQYMTAKLILALSSQNEAKTQSALDAWLDARRTAPENFLNDVLAAPELVPFIAKLAPEKLVSPTVKVEAATKADRAIIRDISAAKEQAVTENLEWLRPLGVLGTVKSIAKTYRIAHVNHYLREVTVRSRKDWPDLIIAVDKDGAMIGSFLAH